MPQLGHKYFYPSLYCFILRHLEFEVSPALSVLRGWKAFYVTQWGCKIYLWKSAPADMASNIQSGQSQKTICFLKVWLHKSNIQT